MLGAGQTGVSGLSVGGAGYGLQDGVRMCGNSDRHVLTGWCTLSAPFCSGLQCRAQGWRSIRRVTVCWRRAGRGESLELVMMLWRLPSLRSQNCKARSKAAAIPLHGDQQRVGVRFQDCPFGLYGQAGV